MYLNVEWKKIASLKQVKFLRARKSQAKTDRQTDFNEQTDRL